MTTEQYKDAIVYAYHNLIPTEGGSVCGDGIIVFYSFNTGENLIIARRELRSTYEKIEGMIEGITGFIPNLVDILFTDGKRLYDTGTYGLYDTLKNSPLFEKGEVNGIACHKGIIYFSVQFSSGGIAVYRLLAGRLSPESRDWKTLRKKGIIPKSRYEMPLKIEANGKIYIVNNKYGGFGSSYQKGVITDQEGTVIVEVSSAIDDIVVFPEDIILEKLPKLERR